MDHLLWSFGDIIDQLSAYANDTEDGVLEQYVNKFSRCLADMQANNEAVINAIKALTNLVD